MRDVTLVILNSLRIKCHIRRPLTFLSRQEERDIKGEHLANELESLREERHETSMRVLCETLDGTLSNGTLCETLSNGTAIDCIGTVDVYIHTISSHEKRPLILSILAAIFVIV